MIHFPTKSIVMGPYIIGDGSDSTAPEFRKLKGMENVRIGGMAEHLTKAHDSVYLLGMEGQFWEANLVTLEVVQLYDLCHELDFCKPGEQQHGKAAFTRNGRTYVAFNTFEEADFVQSAKQGYPYNGGGRFAEFDGTNWTVLESTAFMEVTGRTTFGGVTYALGWDAASVVLKVLDPEYPKAPMATNHVRLDARGVPDWVAPGSAAHASCSSMQAKADTLFDLSHEGAVFRNTVNATDCCALCAVTPGCLTWSHTTEWPGSGNCHLSPYAPLATHPQNGSTGGSSPGAPAAPPTSSKGQWQTYRLPKASHAFDHLWQTEWPRIREVETERYLMDMHGMFYELSPLGWGGSTWGVKPVAQHLRIIPDFCSWRGMLVLGGNQVTPHTGANLVTGQAQAGMWFGKTDDLFSQFGKPQGWGGPWRNQTVSAGEASDPYLMTGFDKKVLHLTVAGPQPSSGCFAAASHRQASEAVTFTIEVDFTGTAGPGKVGEQWHPYAQVTVVRGCYGFHTFPVGFSAHWVRVRADSACVATAYFHYS